MTNDPKRCLGYGHIIAFRTIGQGLQQRSVPVDYEKLLNGIFEVHICVPIHHSPQKFLPAIEDYTVRVKCIHGCDGMVYKVPVRGDWGFTLFERLIWGIDGWKAHPHGEFPIWNYLVEALKDGSIKLSLPNPVGSQPLSALSRYPGLMLTLTRSFRLR